MSKDRIILQFVDDGLWVTAFKTSLKNGGAVVGALSSLNEGRISDEILHRLKTAVNVPRAEVILILPQRQVIYKYFTFPSKNKEELRRMLALQIGQGLAFPVSEMIYDWTVVGEDDQGQSQVVAALARQKSVEQCLQTVTSSGLLPTKCCVSAFGVRAWLAERFSSIADKTVAVIDVYPDYMEFCVCRHQRLLFARGIALSLKTPQDAELTQSMLATLEVFKRAYPQATINELMLTGLKRHYPIIQSVCSTVFKVPCQEAKGDSLIESHEQGLSFAAITGISRVTHWELDLMPASAQNLQVFQREKLALVRMFAAFLVCVLSLLVFANGQVAQQQRRLGVLQQALNQYKDDYQRARRNLTLYETLADDRKHKVIMVEMIKELYNTIPPSVVLTSLQFSDGNLTILGQTGESADVGFVQKSMMGSSFFSDVTLQYANRPQRLGMELTEFKMICRVKAQWGGDQ